MSVRGHDRALARMVGDRALLARERDGPGFGVYLKGDRRRRPVARIAAAAVQALEAEGLIERAETDGFVLSAAGKARARRDAAVEGEAFFAQHGDIVARFVMDEPGAAREVRAWDGASAMRRLAGLKDASGKAWLAARELAAAAELREDWERAQAGLVRGSDWRAPPKGDSARAVNGQEAAMAARCDAERRFRERLAKLAPPLRRVVERVCLYDDGVEALERAEGWPARSGKVALKLGLAQLATR